VIRLPDPLTLSFMTYANDLAHQTEAARRAGPDMVVEI
jgi:hypothetical protein